MAKILIYSDTPGLVVTPKAVRYLAVLGVLEALKFLEESKERKNEYLWITDTERDDPRLIAVYYFLKKEFSDKYADLIIIPDTVEWSIKRENDGSEKISEKHREWYKNRFGKIIETYG